MSILFIRTMLLLGMVILAGQIQAQQITEKIKNEQEEVLKEDPRNFAANYVVGAYYFNQAIPPHLQTTTMTLTQYLDEGNPLEEEKKKSLRKALPYLENAYALNSNERRIKEILLNVYQHLGMLPFARNNTEAEKQLIQEGLEQKLKAIQFQEIN
ncbi:MAG: hypothetical protein HC913_04115 [Microscillaceae bacterium]|nr:hypothetical protein [Microscillaceae bacterium]